MEPVELTAAAIATLVLTKAFEKTGEKLGESVLEKGANLLALLKRKFPNTASAIEISQQQPLDYGQAVLEKVKNIAQEDSEVAQAVKEVEATAKKDPKFLQAVEALERAIKSQPSTVHNYGKLAESLPNLKAVFQGNTIQGDVTF